jgi:hypothetical protein
MQNDARALYYFALYYYCEGNPDVKVRKAERETKRQSSGRVRSLASGPYKGFRVVLKGNMLRILRTRPKLSVRSLQGLSCSP